MVESSERGVGRDIITLVLRYISVVRFISFWKHNLMGYLFLDHLLLSEKLVHQVYVVRDGPLFLRHLSCRPIFYQF